MELVKKGLLLQSKYKTLLNSYDINTPWRLAHFFAQISHESGLKSIGENLNYSKESLLKTFGKYFKSDIIMPYTKVQLDAYNKDLRPKASDYARKPEKIANRVYANRMGNGNEASGQGFLYRGRGFIQITGKDDYKMLSKDTGIDFLNNPDLLLTEVNSLISALWYWKKHNINALADKNDIKGVTRTINGGYNGIADRTELLNEYMKK